MKYLSRMNTLESPRVAILPGGLESAAPAERAAATLDHRVARSKVPGTWGETEAKEEAEGASVVTPSPTTW